MIQFDVLRDDPSGVLVRFHSTGDDWELEVNYVEDYVTLSNSAEVQLNLDLGEFESLTRFFDKISMAIYSHRVKENEEEVST